MDAEKHNIKSKYKSNKKNNKEKLYLFCIKCGRDFESPSLSQFCDFGCCQEYYQEIRRENDACFGEWIGRD